MTEIQSPADTTLSSEDTAIVMLAGPIKHWWDKNWETPEHWHYVDWRERVSNGLVQAGYLVYRPHEAFKGRWDERAQSVNDTALRAADVICNLTPPEVPSLGTDGEILYAAHYGNALVVPAPPPEDFEAGIQELLVRLKNLDIHRRLVSQEVVIESVPMRPDREWLLRAVAQNFRGHVLRLHYFDGQHRVQATDAHDLLLPEAAKRAQLQTLEDEVIEVASSDVLKLEVLERKASLIRNA